MLGVLSFVSVSTIPPLDFETVLEVWFVFHFFFTSSQFTFDSYLSKIDAKYFLSRLKQTTMTKNF